MKSKMLVTLGVMIYAVAIPILEINATHVFNPEWPPHARLHEVWQLATNSSIGLFSLWLAWGRGQVRLASILALLVMGGFVFAYAIQAGYGGSMVLTAGGAEKTVLGLNLGVVGAAVVILSAMLVLAIEPRQRSSSG